MERTGRREQRLSEGGRRENEGRRGEGAARRKGRRGEGAARRRGGEEKGQRGEGAENERRAKLTKWGGQREYI